MGWLRNWFRGSTPCPRSASPERSFRPGLEELERREVLSASPFTLQGTNLYQALNGQNVLIDSNVTALQVVQSSASQVTLFDLHSNGQLMEYTPTGQWTSLFGGVQSIQGFSDAGGNATLEVLQQYGALWQYSVSPGTWSLIDPMNVQWMQGVANSNGDLATLYWLTSTGQLWEKLTSGQEGQINSFVQSATLNSQGTPQVTYDPVGTYLNQPGHAAALGTVLTGQMTLPGGQGFYAQFTNGAIYWTPQTGAHAIEGTIYQRWLALGGLSDLGLPTADASVFTTSSGSTGNQIQTFQNGAIYVQAASTPVAMTGSSNATIAAALINVCNQLSNPNVQQLTLTAVENDGALDRTAMIDILRGLEAYGAVTTSEFVSLQQLLILDGSLNIPASVQDLAGKVIDGDPANSTYQGTSLGNLAAGSSSSQLDKLIDKWFYGTDLPSSGGYTYQIASGTLFGSQNQPTYQQIVQGEVSDCYLLAALGTLAQRNPQAIQAMITDNHDSLTPGDDTYTVRFWNSSNNSWDYVTVDSKLPVYSSGQFVYAGLGASASSSSNVLWVALIEKASAQESQESWFGRGASNSYQALNNGWTFNALNQLTGQQGSFNMLSSAQALVSAFNSGSPLVIDSSYAPSSSSVVANHTYVVTGYSVSSTGVVTFTLFNPWGINNPWEPGTLTMTWSQIVQNFQSWET